MIIPAENEHRIESWEQLNSLLYGNIFDKRIGRHRSPFAYRGLGRTSEELLTSLMSLGPDAAALEGHLLRNFRKYAHRDAVATDSVWDWLALAQHHGLPTRMLDWSYSPQVAMHFATQDLKDYDKDGVIWCVRYVTIKDSLPKSLHKMLEQEGSDVFTVELLNQSAASLQGLESIQKEPFPMFLEPPSLDVRIVNQSALFSLMSSPTAKLDQWLDSRPEVYFRVVVPAGLKWEIRDKLDQAGTTERVLFPGLDGLSRWLRRYYSPRNNKQ